MISKVLSIVATITLLASPVYAEQAQVTEEKTTNAECLEAWTRVFLDGDMTKQEMVQNAVVSGGSLAALGLGKLGAGVISSTARKVSTTAGGIALVGITGLTVLEKWSIIDSLFKQTLVGAGDLLDEVQEGVEKAGKDFNSEKISQRARDLDPNNAKIANLLCNESNRPVLLGRYIEKLLNE